MKRTIFSIAFALTATIGWAQTTFTVDNLSYTVNEDDATTVSVSMTDDTSGELVIPSSVTYEEATYAVTSIANYGFNGNQAITSVTIPASVTTIGDWAFQNCYSLTNIRIEDSENPLTMTAGYYSPFNADEADTNISERNVYIGRNLTLSENSTVFAGITSVEFGPNVTAITPSMFYGAARLASVTIGNGVTTIGDNAFCAIGTNVNVEEVIVTMGSGVTSIGASAFQDCNKLQAVSLPSGLTEIKAYAFQNTRLTSIAIPASVNTIGDRAFYNCYSLTNIRIEDSENPLTMTAGYYSPFNADEADTNISERIVYIGRDLTLSENSTVFAGITSVEFGPNVTAIAPNLFNGAARLASVTIGNGVTTIGDNAFYGIGTNVNVEEVIVTMGSGVTSIGANAFLDCNKLQAVSLPSGLTEIKTGAFQNTGLTSIAIPASVTTLEYWAFSGCYSLTNIRIEDSENPLTITTGYYSPFSADDADTNISERIVYIGRDLTLSDYSSVFAGITSVEFGPNVTTIASRMFEGAARLANVTIGNDVTTIGDYAFYAIGTNANVEEVVVTMGSGVTSIGASAFLDCNKLQAISLPSGLTEIKTGAFQNTGLTSITIPASVTTIGEWAFSGCYSLTNIRIEDSENPLTITTGYYSPFSADEADTNISERIVYIGRDLELNESAAVFAGITSVEFGPDVTAIAPYLFYGAARLASATIANGVSRIGAGAFYSTALTSITIPASVESIGNEAFNGINTLESVTIADGDTPLTLENNYYGAFQNGEANGTRYTKTVYLGRDIINYENRQRTEFDTVEEITIGPKVTTINDFMFYECAGLQSIDLTNATSLTTIGGAAFAKSGLTSIDIPGTVKVIPGPLNDFGVFEKCYSLATVNLGEGIEEIGHYAFYDCTALRSIILPASLKTIRRGVFHRNDALNNFVIADSDTPLTFDITRYHEEGNYGTTNCTPNHTMETFYLGRNITIVGSEDSFVDAVKNIEIGPKVTGIKQLFIRTDNVESIKVHQVTPITLTEDLCNEKYDNITLLVPGGTKEAYAAADYWQKFTNVDHWSTLVTLTAIHGTIANDMATASNGTAAYRQPKTDAITYTLTADEGYHLTAFTDNDVTVDPLPAVGQVQNRANSDGEELVTLVATFGTIEYTLSYDLAGGTVATANPESYTIESEDITLVNPTRTGYLFTGWTGTGLNEATETVTIASGSTGNRSYTANWMINAYTVSITGSGVTASNYEPQYGDDVVITIAEDEDRTLSSLIVNGEDVTGQVANGQYTIEDVTADVTVVATFVSTKEFITMNTPVATFSCSQDLYFAEDGELKAYIAAGYNKAENTTLLVRVYDVPAGTGLILKGSEGQTYKVPYSTSVSYYVNMLKANLTEQNIPQTTGDMSNFLLNRKDGVYGFYRPSSSSTLGAQKAYLQVPTSFAPADARAIKYVFEDDDEVTNIADFIMPAQPGTHSRYNLNGQRVSVPGKGIYIENGRKVVKK